MHRDLFSITIKMILNFKNPPVYVEPMETSVDEFYCGMSGVSDNINRRTSLDLPYCKQQKLGGAWNELLLTYTTV